MYEFRQISTDPKKGTTDYTAYHQGRPIGNIKYNHSSGGVTGNVDYNKHPHLDRHVDAYHKRSIMKKSGDNMDNLMKNNSQWNMDEERTEHLEKKDRCWEGYKPTPGKKAYEKGSCMKKKEVDVEVAPEGSKNRESYKEEFEDKKKKKKLKKSEDEVMDSILERLQNAKEELLKASSSHQAYQASLDMRKDEDKEEKEEMKDIAEQEAKDEIKEHEKDKHSKEGHAKEHKKMEKEEDSKIGITLTDKGLEPKPTGKQPPKGSEHGPVKEIKVKKSDESVEIAKNGQWSLNKMGPLAGALATGAASGIASNMMDRAMDKEETEKGDGMMAAAAGGAGSAVNTVME